MARKTKESILQERRRRRPRKLDISGRRSRAYRKRRLTLLHRARIAAGVRKALRFRRSRKDRLKRRL